MIPMCARQYVTASEDGISYKFAPKTGEIEQEFVDLSDELADMDAKKLRETVSSKFDKILIGWEDGEKRMPSFPADGKPSKLFNHQEQMHIIHLWHGANQLTIDEKKS